MEDRLKSRERLIDRQELWLKHNAQKSYQSGAKFSEIATRHMESSCLLRGIEIVCEMMSALRVLQDVEIV